ncbi:hypothetical protein [Hymenobacter psychrotolerans]|uniref:Uncharacterized protein n=1 Tax=Hymenobacter psychrotolerans DSM 18569 TaxID=1121959 RepID=A0A1M6WXA2_9BACT|nr:hypothetical protein [Hymenobacter psychrotolerans]SHK98199.1 hypothetical protein SAMN02746009_01923 [Hymenobacter psychrotolerans DSM 18569]
MKTPAEYLQCPVFELTYPTGDAAESVPVIAYNDALRAVEEALADAEKYKYLLMRALRRHRADTAVGPALVPPASGFREYAAQPGTPVLPLYPEGEDEQAA